jgi:hypothetical protein
MSKKGRKEQAVGRQTVGDELVNELIDEMELMKRSAEKATNIFMRISILTFGPSTTLKFFTAPPSVPCSRCALLTPLIEKEKTMDNVRLQVLESCWHCSRKGSPVYKRYEQEFQFP